MWRPRALVSLAFLLVMPALAGAQSTAPVACSDSLYLALKRRPVDSLSAREYELFRERDRACLQSGTVQPPAGAPAQGATADASAVATALTEGREAAGSEGTGGWFAGGVGSGLLLGLIGTAVITVAAHNSSMNVPASQQSLLSAKSPEYAQAFTRAYRERLRSKKRTSALTGGLLGTAAFLAIYLSAQSED